ncbi:MAG: ATP-binding protein [Fimbriimonas sp.]
MAALPFELPPDAWEIFDVSIAPNQAGLHRYLDRVLLHCEHLFAASGVSLFLREGDSDTYRLAARRGASARIPAGASIQVGVGLAGEAIERRASALVHAASTKRNVGSSMVVPLVAPDGEVLGVLNVARKVSQSAFHAGDLRHADTVARQLALAVGNARLYSEARQAEARLSTLLEAVPSPMFVLDAAGDVTARNGAARALTSLPALDLRGRQEHGGRVFWISARPIPTGGQVVTVDDVTERERASAEAAKLRHLAEIGQMTATIAHEIRNPLTGIRSAAQMLTEAPEHSAEWAQIVEDEATRLEGLCDQFLTFARPLDLRLQRTDLTELCLRVVTLHRTAYAEANVTLLVDTPCEAVAVPADLAKMEQVLHNLLRNALQASAAGGRVVVGVQSRSISVADNGCGMTAEELENAGRPFFTTKTRGTGLGLGTVKKIVEAHGGHLNMESEKGKGTRVTVVLPESHL